MRISDWSSDVCSSDLGFVGWYKLAETARRSEGEAKEFELVRRGSRALFEQVDAARAHFRVFFVGEQFEAVGEGADRAQEVVTQARGQHRGEIDAIVGHLQTGSPAQ